MDNKKAKNTTFISPKIYSAVSEFFADAKLTENYEVSNAKIKVALGIEKMLI